MRKLRLPVAGSPSAHIIIQTIYIRPRVLLRLPSFVKAGKFRTWPKCSANFLRLSCSLLSSTSGSMLRPSGLVPLEGMDNVDWRNLLQFSTVQTLQASRELAGHVALALEHMVPGELPSLDLILLAGQLASSVQRFINARNVSGYPVTVADTEWEFDKRLKSYVSE